MKLSYPPESFIMITWVSLTMSDIGKDCQTIKTERVVSLKIISRDAGFISDHFIVLFLKKKH